MLRILLSATILVGAGFFTKPFAWNKPGEDLDFEAIKEGLQLLNIQGHSFSKKRATPDDTAPCSDRAGT